MASQTHGAGTQRVATSFYAGEDGPKRTAHCVIRFVALVATFVAAIVMGVAGEKQSLLATSGVAFRYHFKAAGIPQFDYFIAVNSIACFYSAASLAICWAAKGWTKNLEFALAVVDLVTVVSLFAGEGSALAMGVLLRRGYGDIYPRACNVYRKFCGHVYSAVVLSMFAAVAYLVLAVLFYLNIYKRAL